jgi:hypothetical protein
LAEVGKRYLLEMVYGSGELCCSPRLLTHIYTLLDHIPLSSSSGILCSISKACSCQFLPEHPRSKHNQEGRSPHSARRNNNRRMADSSEYETFKLGNWELQSGQKIFDAHLAFKTFGDPKLPAILYPSWFSGGG